MVTKKGVDSVHRNSYIQNKSFWTFFMASVLVSLVYHINMLVDGVIVSHFVSPDVLSVYKLAEPIMYILFIFPTMITKGAAVVVTKEIGMQKYHEVSKYLISSIITVIAVAAPLSAFFAIYSDIITGWLTDESRLCILLRPYLPIIFFGNFFVAIQLLLMKYITITGHPKLAAWIVIASSIANIILDLLFVGVFSMGIAGAAWATMISVLCSCAYMSFFLFRNNSMIAWVRPALSWIFACSRNLFLNGIPAAVASIAVAVFSVVLNMLVLKTQGADGLFVLALASQLLAISGLILDGAGNSVSGLGGVMLGEGDIDGYRNHIKGVLRKCVIALSAISILIIIYPDFMPIMFGADSRMISFVSNPLRILCLASIPFCFTIILGHAFLLQGHKVLASFQQALYAVCILPTVWVASVFYPEYLWHFFSFGVWIMFLVMVCCTYVISRKRRDLHWFTLIPKYPNAPGISLSVGYDRTSVQKALNMIHKFLDICELDKNLYYKIDHCVEELTCNLISMTENTGKKGSFDIRVIDEGERIFITMKDDGNPYNPVVKYDISNGSNIEEANTALVILNAFCPDLNYKYINGINCVYMKFNYGKRTFSVVNRVT